MVEFVLYLHQSTSIHRRIREGHQFRRRLYIDISPSLKYHTIGFFYTTYNILLVIFVIHT